LSGVRALKEIQIAHDHTMKNRLLLLIFMAVVPFTSLTPRAQAAAAPPNFIFILVDDLGWTDVSCYGSKFYETPNIDRLASQGMRFTQAYAACTVCSPTRAAVLTGKYPARLHITDWIAGHVRPYAKLKAPDWTMHLPLEETTIAEALKPLGYATASIGKWHLGGPAYYPEKQGFDINIAGCDRGQPPSYFSPYKIATITDGPPGEFLTDRESMEACKFIEQNRARPFFLYLPHHAVHTPLMAKKEVKEKYQAKVKPGLLQNNATYAGLVESVDDSVGRILKKLEELNIDDRTVIFLTSDNGGLVLNRVTDNSPLRAGKGSAYEGGVRVISIVKWPGVAKRSSAWTTIRPS
jgi:arylsulfatase A